VFMLAGMFVFFFQAEDGIRDDLVTGVQTCALPICLGASAAGFGASATGLGASGAGLGACGTAGAGVPCAFFSSSASCWFFISSRSEERRVGKECRSRVWRSD